MSRPVAVLLLALAAQENGAERLRPRIEALEVTRRDQSLGVSYRLADALAGEPLEQLQAGIAVTFRHRLEASWERGFFTPNRTLGRASLTTSAEYDSLTRQYVFTREYDPSGAAPAAGPERRSTDDPAELQRWMEDPGEIALALTREAPPEARIELRVDVTLGRRYVLLVFPASLDVRATTRVPG